MLNSLKIINKAFFLILIPLSYSWGYPKFIGLGYKKCLTCHYNPYGNGPLTDYGRALGANTISGRLFSGEGTTDEDLSNRSGFLGTPSTKWLRPSIGVRYINGKSNLGTTNEKDLSLLMQANASLVMKFGKDDSFYIVGEYGYAPDPIKPQQEKEDNYRSREHYIGYHIDKNVGAYVGFFDKAYGIRTENHYALSRITTQNTMNDGVHGAMIHLQTEKFEVGLHGFAGNLSQKKEVRQSGFSVKAEMNVGEKSKYGLSLLSSKSEFLENLSFAFHGKIGMGKGNSILLEAGQAKKDGILSRSQLSGQYFTFNNSMMIKRGLFLFNQFEYLRSDLDSSNYVYRIGPGLQYFPLARVEFRVEFYYTRGFYRSFVQNDRKDLFAQVHLWF